MPAIAKKGILYTETPSVENRVVEGNQNPVTSGAVYKEIGDTSINNDLGANVSNQIENLHTQMQTKLTQIQSQIHTNLLNPTTPTQTVNGVTLTNNGDGTYTVNGTASGLAVFQLMAFNDFAFLENKKLIGCPAGGGPSIYTLQINCNRDSTFLKNYGDYGNGVIISNFPSETNRVLLHIVVFAGQTVNNLIFKPMLTTDLNATYDDFVPYTGDSGRLNEDISDVNRRLTQVQSQMVPMFNNAGAHNAIYRGKNLGTSVTTAQYNAIKAGTFDDLYIGDYWVINGVTWRIAAFDYYLRCGDTDLTTHHAVIVPDSSLYSAKMNDTNTTAGGYVGSQMYTTNLANAKTTIKTAFSGHVLSHRIYLVNAVSNGRPSGGVWCDSEVDLMNEQMVYGGSIFSPTSDGSTVPSNHRVEKSQLPLFRYRPDLISNRVWYWLRDIVSGANFAYVNSNGLAHVDVASYSFGVRPAFCIS